MKKPQMEAQNVVFVSGHLDLTKEEFHEHYVPAIHRAAEEGRGFVIGDAPGCDYMTQRWIHHESAARMLENRPPIPRIVYHMLERPRHNFGRNTGKAATEGGFLSDNERDAAMTEASSADIAWVRPGKERSGTAKNLARRAGKEAKARELATEAERATWTEVKVTVDEEYPVYGFRNAPSLAVNDDGSPIERRLPRVPQDLLDRLAAACQEKARLQQEIMDLIAEQGFYRDGF